MKKILVVDDEQKVREVYLSLLKEEGFEAIEAQDALEANEILKKEPIDLVLLDIKMPGVDGCVLHEVMQLFHKGVKVIVASVYPVYEQKRIIKDAAGYYDKSQGTNVLLSMIKKVLQDTTMEESAGCEEERA